MLASKVNDSKDVRCGLIVDQSIKVFGVSKKEVLAQEFMTYVLLEFSLIVSMEEIQPHLKRVIEEMGIIIILNFIYLLDNDGEI